MRARGAAFILAAALTFIVSVASSSAQARIRISYPSRVASLAHAMEGLHVGSEVFTVAGVDRAVRCVGHRRVAEPSRSFATEGRVSIEHDEGELLDAVHGGVFAIVRDGIEYDLRPAGWMLPAASPWGAYPVRSAATLAPFDRPEWVGSEPEPHFGGAFPGLLQLLHAARHLIGPRQASLAGEAVSEFSFSEPIFQLFGASRGGPVTEVTVDIARSGLPVRIVQRTRGEELGDETVTYTILAVDVPIAPVVAPPAGQTVTLAEAVRRKELRLHTFRPSTCGRLQVLLIK